MENLLLKTPYKFKKSYGGTPEPQTAQDAPWLCGPSLKKYAAHAAISSYGIRSFYKNIRARGRVIFLFFPLAAVAR